MFFHYRGLECKSGKSRNTWSKRQVWPWSTEWSRAKANRVLPREGIRLKLKKVGKTTKPFRYDLNQIPYDYAMEVTNRFKGLDLIECLKNYGWRFMTLNRKQWSRPSPRKKNAKLLEEALHIAEKRREAKGKGKRKDEPIWMQSSKE